MQEKIKARIVFFFLLYLKIVNKDLIRQQPLMNRHPQPIHGICQVYSYYANNLAISSFILLRLK